ncbi:class I SAM-dependent DNA methyltransferase [Halopelagius longus]|uniref:Class I SAM-dependent methyltransferase n=1 Tax=Halopelagius longus TaxID=1236180 RepID=A0A1H1FHA0_9EURY|nr:class I SAM-dependent methyltransferase [Halopelagius longus]RDI70105.1 class I SAM-dependent methyltransferase [Halopelagius longus]SDR00240.1 Methyltransferase domain-containing protein [Halopelagius longus]
MNLSAVIDDVNENPHRRRSFYEYPELYDFYHSRVLDREAQVGLLERFSPEETARVLEFGCGTGPLLARIEGEYDEVFGVDSNESMLERAEEKVETATLRRADFTAWSAADEGRVFDVAVLMGGLLHLTDDRNLESFAENAHESLRDGGAFATFFQPLSDDVENGSTNLQTVESDRYAVERRSVCALTSEQGHYTTTHLFVITDEKRGTEARMGTVFEGRFHDPESLERAFSAAGFGRVEVLDGDGPSVLHAVK